MFFSIQVNKTANICVKKSARTIFTYCIHVYHFFFGICLNENHTQTHTNTFSYKHTHAHTQLPKCRTEITTREKKRKSNHKLCHQRCTNKHTHARTHTPIQKMHTNHHVCFPISKKIYKMTVTDWMNSIETIGFPLPFYQSRECQQKRILYHIPAVFTAPEQKNFTFFAGINSDSMWLQLRTSWW